MNKRIYELYPEHAGGPAPATWCIDPDTASMQLWWTLPGLASAQSYARRIVVMCINPSDSLLLDAWELPIDPTRYPPHRAAVGGEMTPIIKYFLLTLKHKWFVFMAGLKTKANLWDLIIHDWTKFFPSELPHYGRQFFGRADDPEGFISCWVHHQNHNKHHWEYWIPRTGHNRCQPPFLDNQPIPMPERYVREMVADWLGAGRAYEGKWPNVFTWPWLVANKRKMLLHQNTSELIDKIVLELQGRPSHETR